MAGKEYGFDLEAEKREFLAGFYLEASFVVDGFLHHGCFVIKGDEQYLKEDGSPNIHRDIIDPHSDRLSRKVRSDQKFHSNMIFKEINAMTAFSHWDRCYILIDTATKLKDFSAFQQVFGIKKRDSNFTKSSMSQVIAQLKAYKTETLRSFKEHTGPMKKITFEDFFRRIKSIVDGSHLSLQASPSDVLK